MSDNEAYIEEEKKRIKYENELAQATEIISKLADIASHRRDVTPLIHAFKNEHRTLQQGIFGMMLKIVEAVADDDYRTDLRNEDSKAIAQKLLAGFKEVKRQDYINEGCSPSRADQYVTGEFSKPSNYLRHI
jgi:hypothetical protein